MEVGNVTPSLPFIAILSDISHSVVRNVWYIERTIFQHSNSTNFVSLKASLKAPNVAVRFITPDNGRMRLKDALYTRVGTLIVETIYLQLIQNRYMFRSFTVLQCSHQHCVQPVASDVEVVGNL